VVRVASVALAQAWFELDLSSGWRHELLGYVTILLALAWLVSTDYCLAFLLRPIVLRNADISRFASRPNPLTDVWNWCLGAGWKVRKGGKRRGRQVRDGGSPSSPEPLPPPPPAVGRFRDYWWLGGFGLLAALQIASFAVPAADRGQASRFQQFQRADMPADLDGWSPVGYELVERGRGAQDGQFSSEWRYRRGPLECRVSVDYPFHGWHELTMCYTGNGWVVLNRRAAEDLQEGGAGGEHIEAELSKPTGEFGWLLFGLFGRTGEYLVPTEAVGGTWPSLREKLARSPLGSWLLGQRYGGLTEATYQVQVFASNAVGLSPAQRAEVRRLFLSVRSRVVTAYLGKATEGERKP
jgi:hypothetical protein